MIPFEWYFIVSFVLFTIGVLGVLVRRNAIVIFMCIELMLNAANLLFVGAAHYWATIQIPAPSVNMIAAEQIRIQWMQSAKDHAMNGQVLVFFVMVVAAAEVAVGLAIIVTFFRNKETVDVDQVNLLKY